MGESTVYRLANPVLQLLEGRCLQRPGGLVWPSLGRGKQRPSTGKLRRLTVDKKQQTGNSKGLRPLLGESHREPLRQGFTDRNHLNPEFVFKASLLLMVGKAPARFD